MALPLNSLLQAPARLAAPTAVTITHIGSPKPVLPPGDVLVTGHGCVPRLCPQAVSPEQLSLPTVCLCTWSCAHALPYRPPDQAQGRAEDREEIS